jgi:hypothetical protein
MKTKFLIIVPTLILVMSLCTILNDRQRDTRGHVLMVTPQSSSPDAASPVVVGGTVSDSDHDLQENMNRVAVNMVKTDEAHLRELGLGWMLDDGPTGFRGSGWKQGCDSLNYPTAEQAADGKTPQAPQPPH